MAKRQKRFRRVPAVLTTRHPRWTRLSDRELLRMRLCDLNLTITNSPVQPRIRQLYAELERKRIRFRPHFWFSTEWFTPDGIPGIAVPFYMAHPRLMQLERRQMLDIEGGTRRWCMQLLRHEAGHAIDNAYTFRRQHAWRRLFGKFSLPYPEYYQPKPYSKRFVIHLDYWYAQAHPAEDFAETFAVWLTPNSLWRRRYADWPAIKKLEYVDEQMKAIAGKRPPNTCRDEVECASDMRMTLGEHYERKKARYSAAYPDFYDRDLRRLFADDDEYPQGELAATFLNRIRPRVRRLVARLTGEYQYTIDQVLREMIQRCRHLRLRRTASESQVKLEATVIVTIQTMNYLHAGHHRLVL